MERQWKGAVRILSLTFVHFLLPALRELCVVRDTNIRDTSQRVVTAAGVPNWSLGTHLRLPRLSVVCLVLERQRRCWSRGWGRRRCRERPMRLACRELDIIRTALRDGITLVRGEQANDWAQS